MCQSWEAPDGDHRRQQRDVSAGQNSSTDQRCPWTICRIPGEHAADGGEDRVKILQNLTKSKMRLGPLGFSHKQHRVAFPFKRVYP